MNLFNLENLSKNKYFHLLIIIILSSIIIFNYLGETSLNNWDEGTYAQVAKEMTTSNDWLTLHHKNNTFWDKPPLNIWLTALTYNIFGINEFTARFWSGIFGLLAIIFTYLIGRKLFNPIIGLFSALILLTIKQFMFFHAIRSGDTDITLTFFILAAIYFFIKKEDNSRYIYLTGLFTGLAILTKSAVGLLPVIILVLYCLIKKDFKIFKKKKTFIAAGITLAITLPWHLIQFIINHDLFMKEFVYNHMIKLATGPNQIHLGKWFFYISTVFNSNNNMWFIFILFALIYLVIKLFSEKNKFNYLLFIGIIAPFVIFSSIQTKIWWYIFPAYPFLSIMTGKMIFEGLNKNNRLATWLTISSLVLTFYLIRNIISFQLSIGLIIILLVIIILKKQKLKQIMIIFLIFIIFMSLFISAFEKTNHNYTRNSKNISEFALNNCNNNSSIVDDYNINLLLPADYFYLNQLYENIYIGNIECEIFITYENKTKFSNNEKIKSIKLTEEYKRLNKIEPLIIIKRK